MACRNSLPELLGDAHAEGAALEPIFSEVFVKAVNVDRQDPREIGQTELASHSVDLVKRIGCGAAAIVGDLPCVITSWTDFEQQSLVCAQRQQLADAPAKAEIVTRRQIEIFFLAVGFVGQRSDNGGGFVSHRIKCDRPLELVSPKTIAKVVSVFDFNRASDRDCSGSRVIPANRCIEPIRESKVKMRQ